MDRPGKRHLLSVVMHGRPLLSRSLPALTWFFLAAGSILAATAAELVRFGQAIRRLESGGLREVASTRVLIAAGRLVSEGLTMQEAATAAIAGPLTDDVAVGRALTEMIQIYLRPDGL